MFILNHSIGELAARQGNGKSYNENIAPYNNAIRKIVNDLKTDFIDIPLQMSLRDIDANDFVSGDKIHLSLEANHVLRILFILH